METRIGMHSPSTSVVPIGHCVCVIKASGFWNCSCSVGSGSSTDSSTGSVGFGSGSVGNNDTVKDVYVGIGFSNNAAYQVSFEIERELDGEDEETLFELSGRYFMAAEISTGLAYEWDTSKDDYSAIKLSVRYDFK